MTGPHGLGDLVQDPDETIRRMDDWAAGFAAKAQRYQAAQEQTERLRLTATSADGAVSVTVGADGTVTDLTFSNKVKSFPLEELSRQILTTMRRAQSGIADRVAGVMPSSSATRIARPAARCWTPCAAGSPTRTNRTSSRPCRRRRSRRPRPVARPPRPRPVPRRRRRGGPPRPTTRTTTRGDRRPVRVIDDVPAARCKVAGAGHDVGTEEA